MHILCQHKPDSFNTSFWLIENSNKLKASVQQLFIKKNNNIFKKLNFRNISSTDIFVISHNPSDMIDNATERLLFLYPTTCRYLPSYLPHFPPKYPPYSLNYLPYKQSMLSTLPPPGGR